MTKRPYILLTNDDGIHAPGLKHLWLAIKDYADVVIVAPQTEKSGSGLSITYMKPLIIHEVPWETPAWSVNGTPADCVKMALSVILERKPDMIVSGINAGSNAGRTVLYSGTVGGVIEGALKDIPGIAFSFSDFTPPPLESTKKYIYPIIEHFLENPLPLGTLLNVNFPLDAKERIKGFKMAKQGKGCWLESPDKRAHPQGTPYYWLGGGWVSGNEEIDSDVYWLDNGYITGAPVHVKDLTDRGALEDHKALVEAKFEGDLLPN
jgi:5'-nucleotidase